MIVYQFLRKNVFIAAKVELKLLNKAKNVCLHSTQNFGYFTMSRKVQKVSPSDIKAGKADFPLIASLCAPGFSTNCKRSGDFPKKFTEEELKSRLTSQQYSVTQKSGTERAFAGEFWDNHRDGVYNCIVCGENLFNSDVKYESGSGWPSFHDVIDKTKVKLVSDNAHGMIRTEVLCSQCGSHLGHIFDDGPAPTGKRYCMNSASLGFKEKKEDL